jgi:hypothetical protein
VRGAGTYFTIRMRQLPSRYFSASAAVMWRSARRMPPSWALVLMFVTLVSLSRRLGLRWVGCCLPTCGVFAGMSGLLFVPETPVAVLSSEFVRAPLSRN